MVLEKNPEFEIAAQLVLETQQHVFLTGNAGTGKTTFLRHIREKSLKNLAVIAPTGVAAINAGGVTLHSFFQLPFGMFLSDYAYQSGGWPQVPFYDRAQLFKNARISQDKRKVFNALELLIIDEISMVRADTLDAIDAVLRHYRGKPLHPFGGVQVLFIGDLYQLPPVVQDEEWQWLQQHYPSPYFFDAKVLRSQAPLLVELKKIYRQQDLTFIEILNAVRNNRLSENQLEWLHQFYQPDFEPQADSGYITLTTHNYKAQAINEAELAKLSSTVHTYSAKIEGDFQEKLYPVEPQLQLKVGAQVMFIKNDKGEERRYFNGKLAKISRINAEGIHVKFEDQEAELLLEKEEWKNIRYQLNEAENKLEEITLGRFLHYPIRLAWAITIHKSQGLTFEKAIIDAGDSFSPGQVYVALSRLTGTSGLVLKSRLRKDSLQNDAAVARFLQQESKLEELQQAYEKDKGASWRVKLEGCFDWSKGEQLLEKLIVKEHKKKKNAESMAILLEITDKIKAQRVVSNKFILQLQTLFQQNTPERAVLEERVNAACTYFNSLLQQFLQLTQQFPVSGKKKSSLATEIRGFVEHQEQQLAEATQWLGYALGDPLQAPKPREIKPLTDPGPEKVKLEKGESALLSLQLFQAGKSIPEIAAEREMAPSTIEGHLASMVKLGKLSLHALVSEEKVAAIREVLNTMEEPRLNPAKAQLGDDFSYMEIRVVLNALLQEKNPGVV